MKNVKLVKLEKSDIEFLINVVSEKKESLNINESEYDKSVVLLHILNSYND